MDEDERGHLDSLPALVVPTDPSGPPTHDTNKTQVIMYPKGQPRPGRLPRVGRPNSDPNLDLLEQSLTDDLTGLGNRRRMEEDLIRTHARALRVGRTYGVALFDVDHFKLYNDHYGHVAGDETLRNVAACIDFIVRAGECAYRYGGEEFLLLMPDLGLGDSVLATGERIRRAVMEAAIPHAARPSFPPFVTLSGGVTSWSPGSPLSFMQVVEQADQALFQAKSAGRNRIHATPGSVGDQIEPTAVSR
ncbi:MAG: GGDEF domain-containing protein [Acidimicrobiales bacterium]